MDIVVVGEEVRARTKVMLRKAGIPTESKLSDLFHCLSGLFVHQSNRLPVWRSYEIHHQIQVAKR